MAHAAAHAARSDKDIRTLGRTRYAVRFYVYNQLGANETATSTLFSAAINSSTGFSVTSFSPGQFLTYQFESFSFIGTGSDTLTFTALDSNASNWVLDDVSIAAVTATPLPAALPLFAGGLAVMGLFGWRRRRLAHAA